MKMGKLEKLFVNSLSHSQRVSQHTERLLNLVDFKAGQKYLDVGCGNGAAAIHLAQKYHLDVTGIDVDPDQIRLAQEQSQGLDKARFLTIDSTQLPFEDGQFDIVFTNKVTHHIPDWENALAEMIRVLKPKGYLIYADLIYPGWLAPIGQAVAGNHAGFPTSSALNSIFEQHGLAKIHFSKSPVHYEAVLQKLTD
jgi:ubiquinone/menaquinone biosynthesis C-methylase UbiE